MSRLAVRVKDIYARRNQLNPLRESSPLDEERQQLSSSLHEFFGSAWPQIEGNKPLIDGWHIQAICEHLEAALRGDIKKLLISVPPRTSKTTVISVMWPAWTWIQHPSLKFLFSSYAQRISWEHSRICRLLIESPWYQERWGHIVCLSKDQATKGHFTNTAMGHRIATSVDAGGTALGGDVLVMDDPNDAGESEVTSNATNDWVSRVWPSRLNPGSLGVNVLVQQRTREMDVSGFLMSRDNDWVKLILPMEFETDRRAKTIILPSSYPKVWQDPRTKENELLCPNYLTPADIANKKISLGEYNYAGQYQQRPSPAAGGIIRRDSFQVWDKEALPDITYVLQSWDTALTDRKSSSYSACTTWGIFRDKQGIDNVMLLTAWRDRTSYTNIVKRAARLYGNYLDINEEAIEADYRREPDRLLVEAKASGMPLVSDLVSKGIPATGFNPDEFGDKIRRVHLITSFIECGRVWVTAEVNSKRLIKDHEMLVHMCTLFPNSESRDLVDTMTQALLYLSKKVKILKHVMDPRFERGIDEDDKLHKKEFAGNRKVKMVTGA